MGLIIQITSGQRLKQLLVYCYGMSSSFNVYNVTQTTPPQFLYWEFWDSSSFLLAQGGQSTTTEYSFLCSIENPETFKYLSLENPPEDLNIENSSVRRGKNKSIHFFKGHFLLQRHPLPVLAIF